MIAVTPTASAVSLRDASLPDVPLPTAAAMSAAAPARLPHDQRLADDATTSNPVRRSEADAKLFDPRHQPLLRPPSLRDGDVYHAVVIEGISTWEVAKAMRISQTRVRQIVWRMLQWLAAVLPAGADAVDPKQHLALARGIAADRLDTLYRDAMQLFRSTGQSRYGGLAQRVACARGRLADLGWTDGLISLAIEPEPPEQPGEYLLKPDPQLTAKEKAPADAPAKSQASGGRPPSGYFSAKSANCAGADATADRNGDATGDGKKSSACLTPQQRAARKTLLSDAKPLLTPANDEHSDPPILLDDRELESLLRRGERRNKRLRRTG